MTLVGVLRAYNLVASVEEQEDIAKEDQDVQKNVDVEKKETDESDPNDPSFGQDDDSLNGAEREDLSMFERNLTLPENGADCMDANPQASKYLLVFMMRRVASGFRTWMRSNIFATREEKIKCWKAGYRPDVTGNGWPVKAIDPKTGEPEDLTNNEILQRYREIKSPHMKDDASDESPMINSFRMIQMFHRLRWGYYRAGFNDEDFRKMQEYNQEQTRNQIARLQDLHGSVEPMMVQSDPSCCTMTKLLKLAFGCETFSILDRKARTHGRHLAIDVEALVGPPDFDDTDQEAILILNNYGFNNLRGRAFQMLQRMRSGEVALSRHIVLSEEYKGLPRPSPRRRVVLRPCERRRVILRPRAAASSSGGHFSGEEPIRDRGDEVPRSSQTALEPQRGKGKSRNTGGSKSRGKGKSMEKPL